MKDKVSVEKIKQLHPKVRETFTNFITECENTFGVTIRIVEPVFRSIDDQNKLYQQGRDAKGNIIDKSKVVTNAKGGRSFHNYGLAIDMVVLTADGEPNWEYDNGKFVTIAKKYELEWGGDWGHPELKHKLVDKPHFEKKFNFKEDCSDLIKLPRDKDGYPIF